ncbi:MAG: ribosome-recycling factor, partial [Patescibacteria group bacterium]
MNQYIENKQDSFTKTIDFFKKDIASLRVGRVNANLIDGVQVDAYGVKSHINTIANININDAKSLAIIPWDKNIIKSVEKAIVEADLGLGVINEGDKIRITVPDMTEETRKELVKKLNEKLEKARINIRQVRDEIKDSIEKDEEAKLISEDDKFRFIKELDEEIKNKNDEIKEMRDKKEEEIM